MVNNTPANKPANTPVINVRIRFGGRFLLFERHSKFHYWSHFGCVSALLHTTAPTLAGCHTRLRPQGSPCRQSLPSGWPDRSCRDTPRLRVAYGGCPPLSSASLHSPVSPPSPVPPVGFRSRCRRLPFPSGLPGSCSFGDSRNLSSTGQSSR